MPYVTRDRRPRLDRGIAVMKDKLCDDGNNAGGLNYVITRICDDFLGGTPSYDDFNAVIGVLECAKLELYRRRVAKYEDGKCSINGDVYSELPLGGGEDYTSCQK